MERAESFIKKYRLLVLGAVLVFIMVVLAIIAPVIVPYDPCSVDLAQRLQHPKPMHILGTDGFGRDILSRILYGSRVSLSLAIAVVAVNMTLGLIIGSIAGYAGGVTDEVIMRIVDILMSFPGLILSLCIIGIFGPSIRNMFIALIVLGWVGYARMSRGLVLTVKEQTFIEASRGLGGSRIHIIFRHIIPNILPTIVIMAALHIGHTVLAIASLSFLGLGVQPPTPEWGTMLNEGKQYIFTYPYIMIFPGLAITVTVFAFNILGDGLRDLMDPRLKEVIKT